MLILNLLSLITPETRQSSCCPYSVKLEVLIILCDSDIADHNLSIKFDWSIYMLQVVKVIKNRKQFM